MTSPNPVVGASDPSSGTSTPASTPNNTLGPNSFITLLTAQLQAQDPLDPMDPDQMVNELTSINSLQQLVQIRSDLDTLAGVVPSAQSGTDTGSTAQTTAAAAVTAATTPAATKTNSVLSVGPKLYSQLYSLNALNSNSQSY